MKGLMWLDKNDYIKIKVSQRKKVKTKTILIRGEDANLLITDETTVKFQHQLLQQYFCMYYFNVIPKGFIKALDAIILDYYSEVWWLWSGLDQRLLDKLISLITKSFTNNSWFLLLKNMIITALLFIASFLWMNIINERLVPTKGIIWIIAFIAWCIIVFLPVITASFIIPSSLIRGSLFYERACSAVTALGYITDPKAVEPIIKVLKYRGKQIRINAIEALGRIGDKRAVEPLLEQSKSRNKAICVAAIQALSNLDKLDDPSLVEVSIRLLKDKNYDIRDKAAEALGKIGDKRAVQALTELLTDSERLVRWTAIEALGELKDERAVMPLIELFETDNSYSARKALSKIGLPAVLPLISLLQEEEFHKYYNSERTLIQIGKPAVPLLIKALEQENNDKVRERVINLLGEIGDVETIPLLVAVLENQNEDTSVRYSAAFALSNIGELDYKEAIRKITP